MTPLTLLLSIIENEGEDSGKGVKELELMTPSNQIATLVIYRIVLISDQNSNKSTAAASTGQQIPETPEELKRSLARQLSEGCKH
jgi:hypothetical protein